MIRWSAHTPASVIFRDSGKTAILDIDGKKLRVSLLTEGYFTLRVAAADENSPVPEPALYDGGARLQYQAVNNGFGKLEIHLSEKGSHRIAVWFKPLAEGEGFDSEAPQVKPLAEW